MSTSYQNPSTPSPRVAEMPTVSATELKNATADVFEQVASRRAVKRASSRERNAPTPVRAPSSAAANLTLSRLGAIPTGPRNSLTPDNSTVRAARTPAPF